MKQIMIDSSTMNTLILILKKSTQIFTIRNGRKKMIDVHAVNKKKVKKVHRFLCARCKKKKKSKESKQKKQRCN